MNARLPEHMMRVSISDMIVGERAYTVPWSVHVDQHGQCWIMGHYAFTHSPFGTSQMPIMRTSDGFEVHATNGTQYEQTYITPETQTQMGLLPVTKIT